jgi:hypothetical protein
VSPSLIGEQLYETGVHPSSQASEEKRNLSSYLLFIIPSCYRGYTCLGSFDDAVSAVLFIIRRMKLK